MSDQHSATANPKMQQFFVTALQEIYWAETHLQSVLTTMGKAATSTELKQAFDLHSEQTAQHKQRLEQVFGVMNMQPQAEPSIGLQGLFDEGWQMIDETEDGSALRDVALIIAAQKVEHYEISCYGSLITLAKTNGQDQIATLLAPTLDEEKETDAVLSSIAQSGINEEAGDETPQASQAHQTPEQEEVRELIRQEVLGREDTIAEITSAQEPQMQSLGATETGSGQEGTGEAKSWSKSEGEIMMEQDESGTPEAKASEPEAKSSEAPAKAKKGKGKSKSKI